MRFNRLFVAGALSAVAAFSALAGGLQDVRVAAKPDSPAPRLGLADAPSKADGAVRLATYNVLNLFDEHDNPALEGRFDDMHSSREGLRAKPDEQLKAVAEAIRRLNADIIGLQEIESFDALEAFNAEYLSDMGYAFVTSIDVGQERGIEQGVLSRFPIREARVWPNMPLGGVHPEKYGNSENWYAGEPIAYRRSPLYVRVEIPSEGADGRFDLELFVIHQKSGYHASYWREAESRGLVNLINQRLQQNPDAHIAVLGDFNAMPSAESIRTYIDDGGLVLTMDSHGTGAENNPTHESDRAIDFIFVNDNLEQRLVPKSAFVLGTPLRPSGSDYRTTPAPEGYAADHLPVAIDFFPAGE
ncbi:endonuclease/exonuclease/phosphatase family protein [Phycisphaerales bacterium ac7]